MQSSSKLEHSTQPQNSRGPMLMYEEFLHLLPMLYQLACAPNSSGFCGHFPKMGFVGEHSVKRDTKIHRPVVVFQPFAI